jgi:hypothetical protein
MEGTIKTFATLPPEVWSHILTFVDELEGVLGLTRVNKIFNCELKKKTPVATLQDVTFDKGNKNSISNNFWIVNCSMALQLLQKLDITSTINYYGINEILNK